MKSVSAEVAIAVLHAWLLNAYANVLDDLVEHSLEIAGDLHCRIIRSPQYKL